MMSPKSNSIRQTQSFFIDFYNQCSSNENLYQRFIQEENKLSDVLTVKHPPSQGDLEVLSRISWKNETPPLEWYSYAISLYHHFAEIPEEILVKLCSCSQYYGDYQFSLSASENISGFYESKKIAAKAHKNLGNFEASQKIYRQVINHAWQQNHQFEMVYNLILYAKLCDDFLQKQGWYKAFVAIAYERINQLKINARENLRPRVIRWEQIAIDSYAKAYYNDNDIKATELFESLLSKKLSPDVHNRVEARYLDSKINFILKDTDLTHNDQLRKLHHYFDHEVLQRCWNLGNERAYNVRVLQSIEIERRILRNNTDFSLSEEKLDDIIDRIDFIGESANKLCDWKTLIYIHNEKAKWYRALGKYEKSIQALNEGIEVIKKKYSDQPSSILIEMLKEQASCYFNINEPGMTYKIYKEAYHNMERLFDEVESDERDLKSKIQPEFKILNDAEIGIVKNLISNDYRLLLKNMLGLSKTVNRIEENRLIDIHNKVEDLKETIDSELHNIVNRLIDTSVGLELNISDKRGAESRNIVERAIAHLRNSINQMLDTRKSFDIYMPSNSLINPFLVIKDSIESYKYLNPDSQSFVHYVEPSNLESVRITFKEFQLRTIVGALVDNVSKLARKKKSINWKLVVELKVFHGLLYLCMTDDLGEYSQFKTVIDEVNLQKPKSIKFNILRGGTGLKRIKNFIYKNTQLEIPFELKQSDSMKELLVPLGKPS